MAVGLDYNPINFLMGMNQGKSVFARVGRIKGQSYILIKGLLDLF